jgi:undecaprenyl-diphosphatase
LSEKIEALTVATLGALQGLTEFLPVSSSGHVAIGARLLDIRENSLVLVILPGNAAFRFSFLISLPAIVGAAVYETISAGGIGALGPMAWIGGVTAFVTGYVALVILGHIIRVGRMWMFAIYLVPLGLLLIAR